MQSKSMSPFLPPSAARRKNPSAETNALSALLGGFKTDDYILLGIIAVLFFEGSDDYAMLAALGYLFVMGIV